MGGLHGTALNVNTITRSGLLKGLGGLVLLLVVGVIGFTLGVHGEPGAARPGAADIGFSQDMVMHHQQAVLMATLALDRATPAVRGIARSILTSQSQEMGMMRGWLQVWGAPLVAATPMAWMAQHKPATDAMHTLPTQTSQPPPMPGMASTDELARLWRARGPAFDVLFMQLMTRHHEGGILMAHRAEQGAHLQYVRDAARGMLFEQAQETSMMSAQLHAIGAQPLPPLFHTDAAATP